MFLRNHHHRHWTSQLPSFAVVAAVLFLLLACCSIPTTCLAGAAAPTRHLQELSAEEEAKISEGIRGSVLKGECVNVLIALVDNDDNLNEKVDETTINQRRDFVASRQNEVLSRVAGTVGGDGYKNGNRAFRAIPTLAGQVCSVQALNALARDVQVEKINVDASGVGTADRYLLDDSVKLIGADTRINSGNDGTGITVGILDSGIDTNHPQLQNALRAEACFLDGGKCPNGNNVMYGNGAAEDDNKHGTHVTGIITSSNGVAPGSNIVSIKVLDDDLKFQTISQIVAALDWIVDSNNPQNIKLINMSLSTNALYSNICDSEYVSFYNVVNALNARGITVFASTANNGSTSQMGSPGCLSNVISVGSSDNNNNAAGSSNSNQFTDVFAPGVGIKSTGLGGSTNLELSGTSMAVPHAVGCAALLIQSGEATTPNAIKSRLRDSDVRVSHGGRTFPRIDCTKSSDSSPPSDDGEALELACPSDTYACEPLLLDVRSVQVYGNIPVLNFCVSICMFDLIASLFQLFLGWECGNTCP